MQSLKFSENEPTSVVVDIISKRDKPNTDRFVDQNKNHCTIKIHGTLHVPHSLPKFYYTVNQSYEKTTFAEKN